MFVHNSTSFACTLARGRLSDEVAVLSLCLEQCYVVGDDGSLAMMQSPAREACDPPDIRRTPLWRGTSVTAWGRVLGPERPPFSRDITYRIDGDTHRLAVHGPRRWVRHGTRGLEPSSPERFDELGLDWALAFGGRYLLAPGILPGSDLPHPGGEVSYVWNPNGVGLYPDEHAAQGAALPQIELAAAPVRTWSDRPLPGGFRPCPELGALRLPSLPETTGASATAPLRTCEQAAASFWTRDGLRHALRLQHHAPGALVLDELRPGALLRLVGLGRRDVECHAPAAPVTVDARRGRSRTPLDARLRSVHLCADRRSLRATFGFSQLYDPTAPPSWLEVTSSGVTP